MTSDPIRIVRVASRPIGLILTLTTAVLVGTQTMLANTLYIPSRVTARLPSTIPGLGRLEVTIDGRHGFIEEKDFGAVGLYQRGLRRQRWPAVLDHTLFPHLWDSTYPSSAVGAPPSIGRTTNGAPHTVSP